MPTDIFKNVRTVAVPVTDQERTKSLLEQLGFTVSMDAELQPGFRWIEMSLAGEATVALVQTGPAHGYRHRHPLGDRRRPRRACRGRGGRARRRRAPRLARRAADVPVRR